MAFYKEDIVDVELMNGTIHRSFLSHTIGAGDALQNRFGVRVFRNGEPENISGTCMGLFIRADGGTVTIASGTVSGNEAYITLPEACYAVEGQFALAIKCQGGGVTGTLRIVDGVVSRTSTDAVVDPGTILPSIETLIDAINSAVASIPLDYSDLNKLAHSAICGSISQFKYPNLLMKLNPKVGYYVNYSSGNENELSTWQYYVVPSPGAYVVVAGGGNTQVAFFAKDGTYLSGANPTWQRGYKFTIPAACAYFTYSCLISDDQYLHVISDNGERALDNSVVAELLATHVNIGNMPDMVKPKKNLFNKYKAIQGGFIDYSSKGSFDSNSNYYFCPWYIPVKPSTTYCPNLYCLVSEFDKDYNWIKCNNMTTIANLHPFTTDSNCRYVRISVQNVDNFQLEEGSATTAYSPFQMAFVGDNESESPSRTIIVDADGGGNYTTISAACGAANDGDTIYICDGTYYESVKINGLRVHLVGESRKGTVLKYLGTQYANPPLEMSNGSIENMTIWAITESGASGGGGYCLHCDNEASANGYLYCRNVKFQNDYYQVIGIGLQPNFTLSFENCEFIGQVYIHDCAKTFETLTGQVIRFTDCAIQASNQPLGAIRMQSQERSGAYATALFQRCIVKNTGSDVIVYMGLWEDTGLAKDGWLGSTDWHLDGMSALNNASILNAE